jgi:hypothetical protein
MGRATTLDADDLVDTEFDTNAGDEVKADAVEAKKSEAAMVGANFIVIDDRDVSCAKEEEGRGAVMDGTPSKF